MFGRKRILAHQRGLYFVDEQFVEILHEGSYWFADPTKNEVLDIVSVKEAWLVHKELESIIKSGKINKDEVEEIDIKDNQRTVSWIEGRFD